MTKYISQKFKLLSFISIVFVIFIHAYYLEGVQWPVSSFIQSFGGCFSGFAVPLFFIISGYLFFYNIEDDVWRAVLKRKLLSRVKSLLLPFIYWSLFFCGFILLCEIIPFTAQFINGGFSEQIRQGYYGKLICEFFTKPLAFHLWFLRDLIVLVILSPAIYALLRFCKGYYGILLLGIIVVNVVLSISVNHFASFFWFSLGGYLGYNKYPIEYKGLTKYAIIILLMYIVLVILRVELILPKNVSILINIIGVLSIWGLYDYVCRGRVLPDDKLLCKCSSYTFFIYCFHEPTLNIFKKLLIRTIGLSQISLIISYFLSVILMLIFALWVGWLLKRKMPRLYLALSGGR